MQSEKRLTKPLIRKKDAPKDRFILEKDKNINDYFREASWEEA